MKTNVLRELHMYEQKAAREIVFEQHGPSAKAEYAELKLDEIVEPNEFKGTTKEASIQFAMFRVGVCMDNPKRPVNCVRMQGSVGKGQYTNAKSF